MYDQLRTNCRILIHPSIALLKQTNNYRKRCNTYVQLQKFHPVTWTRCATQSSHYTEETLCAFSSYALSRRAAAAAVAVEAALRPPRRRRRCRRIQSQAHPLPFSASVVLVLKSERCLHFYTYMYAQTYPAGQGRIGSTSALQPAHSLPCCRRRRRRAAIQPAPPLEQQFSSAYNSVMESSRLESQTVS